MQNFKPLLATEAELDKLAYPKLASVKLDGIRCIIINGCAVTRSLKPIPNKYIRETLSKPEYDGLDGEILCADATDPQCYSKTNSAVMSHDGEPDFKFFVFDRITGATQDLHFHTRLTNASRYDGQGPVTVLKHMLITSREQLDEMEAEALAEGHEGIMLREPDGRYKFGRSTAKEQILLKVKRFADSEAEVIGMVEEMENTNEKTTNELGQSERSSAREGLVGKGTLGAIQVKDLTTGVSFHIGSGFSKAQRQQFWDEGLTGRIVKYKHFPVGVKDLPRFPTFLGFRDASDMEKS
jgi:DNA ligase-1